MYQSLVFIAVSAVPVLVFLKLLLKLRPLRMRSRLATPTPHMLACGQDGCQEGRSSLSSSPQGNEDGLLWRRTRLVKTRPVREESLIKKKKTVAYEELDNSRAVKWLYGVKGRS